MSNDLLTAPVVVVSQMAKFSSQRAEYDLFTPDATPLGRIEEQASFASFFARKLGTLRFAVSDASGSTVATIEKPGAFGRSTFFVLDASGQQVGEVAQDNLLFDPQFTLTTPTGQLALKSPAIAAWDWSLTDTGGTEVGQIHRQFAGLADVFTSAEKFIVQLAPSLTGPTRLIALVACACLDVVRDIRAERNS